MDRKRQDRPQLLVKIPCHRQQIVEPQTYVIFDFVQLGRRCSYPLVHGHAASRGDSLFGTRICQCGWLVGGPFMGLNSSS